MPSSTSAANINAARRVLANWALDDCRLESLPKLFRVEARQGSFALKPVRKSQGRLAFMHRVQEHVRGRGFSRLGFLVPTADGQTAVWRGPLAWTLSQWIDGRELDYRHTAELARSAAVLAAFHLAAAEFPAPPRLGRHTSNVGKWPAKIASRCGELLCAARAARGGNDSFDHELARQAPQLAEHARRSLFILNESGYAQRSRSSDGTLPICHGDPAAHNFILGPDGRVSLIDLNSLRADLPCVDLWKLLHRTGFWRDWDIDVLERVLRAYIGVRPLDEMEATALQGLLWFPEKQWRLAYVAGRHWGKDATEQDSGDEAGPSDMDRLTIELSLAGTSMSHKEACLERLDRLLNEL